MYLKYCVLLLCLSWQLGSTSASGCYDAIDTSCGKEKMEGHNNIVCNAQWGAFPRLNTDTNKLISLHLTHSMQYLLTASYFNEWNVNRPGFTNYFSKLSDEEWDAGTSLMIHMLKRGGKLDSGFKVDLPKWENRQNEIETLGWALDMEKHKATNILHLAYASNHVPKDQVNVPRDAEFAHFLSERLSHQTVLRVKHLANYVNMLSQILQSDVDKAYGVFTFDHEILK